MENIKWMSDPDILGRIGKRLKEWRVEQDVTQKDLASRSELSLATVQQAERCGRVSLETLLRLLRMLDHMEVLEPFIKEREITPVEYAALLEGQKTRKRASKRKS